jgi:uncharacterized protein
VRTLPAPRLAGALAALAAGLFFCLAAFAEVAVPPLGARVTDLTGTLSAAQAEALDSDLKAIEARSSAQFVILLVPTTQPETIEQYGIRVAEAWKIGRKGVDNGLLLLVAKGDRKVRVEVGYGLEGVIPDAIANRVIGETIAPRFRTGDFAGGLAAGVQRLAGYVENVAPDARRAKAQGSGAGGDLPIGLIVALIAVAGVLRRVFGGFFGGLTAGAIGGIGAFFFTGALGIALIAAVGVFLFSLLGFANVAGMALGGMRGAGFGGGFGGGGFSGGGFSGGGGSFGGGGASGSW